MNQRLIYCDLLGVLESASAEEIQHAFRRRAKELHPDHHQQNPAAAAEFRRLMEARAFLLENPYEAPRAEPKAPSHRAPRPAPGPERTVKMDRPVVPFGYARETSRAEARRFALPPALLRRWEQFREGRAGRHAPLGIGMSLALALVLSAGVGGESPRNSPETEAIDANWFLTSSAPGSPPMGALSRSPASVPINVIPPAANVPQLGHSYAPQTWFVDPKRGAGSHAATLGEALALAVQGDEIVLAAGTYRESVVTTKTLTIRAAHLHVGFPNVQIVSSSPGGTVRVTGGALTLRGVGVFQLGGMGDNGLPSAAVAVSRGAALGAKGVLFAADLAAGLYLDDATAEVAGSMFKARVGVQQSGGSFTCNNCTTSGREFGAQFYNDAVAHLSGFTAAGGRQGILATSRAKVRVDGAEVKGAEANGLEVTDGAKLLAERLEVKGCATPLVVSGFDTHAQLKFARFSGNHGAVRVDGDARFEASEASFEDPAGFTAPHYDNVTLTKSNVAGKMVILGR